MDERKRRILVALVFFVAVGHVIAVVTILHKIALYEHYVAMTMVFATMVVESSTSRKTRSIWMYDRSIIFADRLLFGSYSVKLFKQYIRLLYKTFDYLYGVLSPTLNRTYTNSRASNHLRNRIALSLNKFSSGNLLFSCTKTYGIYEKSASIIVKKIVQKLKNI